LGKVGSERGAVALVLALSFAAPDAARAASRPLGKWSFEPPDAGANAVAGGPAARVEGARPAEGREGKALSFEDWSVKDYLKPDPRQATRVVVDGDKGLNPAMPFRISAWIYPTADPIYYGGIAEKGRGLGSSYRLILLRGLKVQASLGDKHVVARSPAPLTLNAWHQVTLSAAGGVLTLTIDGQEAGRASIPPETKISSGDPLIIGERFSGRIDEVELAAD
jgi:hypothetical protein